MAEGEKTPEKRGSKADRKTTAPSREDRLGDALRANLRRRKAAAKQRQKD
ncbi:MAG: hypothetical protein AAGA69_02930 [Pseudomonadota bacterium]